MCVYVTNDIKSILSHFMLPEPSVRPLFSDRITVVFLVAHIGSFFFFLVFFFFFLGGWWVVTVVVVAAAVTRILFLYCA